MTSQGCVMLVTKAIRFSFSKRKRTMALGHELFTIQRVVHNTTYIHYYDLHQPLPHFDFNFLILGDIEYAFPLGHL